MRINRNVSVCEYLSRHSSLSSPPVQHTSCAMFYSPATTPRPFRRSPRSQVELEMGLFKSLSLHVQPCTPCRRDPTFSEYRCWWQVTRKNALGCLVFASPRANDLVCRIWRRISPSEPSKYYLLLCSDFLCASVRTING